MTAAVGYPSAIIDYSDNRNLSHRCPQQGSCHGMSRRMQEFYAKKAAVFRGMIKTEAVVFLE